MKHLKSYKIFESLSEIDTLSDICDDLRDEGYSIDISQPYKGFKTISSKNRQDTIVVEVNERAPAFAGVSIDTDYTLNYFSFVRVKEIFNRMDSYMKSEGYGSELELLQQKMSGRVWVPFSGKVTDKHKGYRIKFFKNESKSERVFESLSTEIKSDIDNILLDLNDEGIQTRCEVFKNVVDDEEFKYMYKIDIYRSNDMSIKYGEVKDIVKRILTYLNSCDADNLDIEIDDGGQLLYYDIMNPIDLNTEYSFYEMEIKFMT